MTGPEGPPRRAPSRRVPQLTPDTPDLPVVPEPNPLPDILNSHLPPPYSTLPGGGRGRLPPPSHPPPPPPCPRARGAPRARRRTVAASESDEPKHCCGVMVTQTVSIRWFIVMIAFVGLCCTIVGIVLGSLKTTGREHLTVSLLMIGVGVVLITVSGIAWRLTSHDAPSCRAMLGLHNSDQEPNRRFVPRVPPYGRPHHPYAAMLYPEFQYRPPPPSYQASMQEYRLRLLLLDRQPAAPLASPPPTYRSHAPSSATLHSRTPLTLSDREYSRPPSYRSRASSAGILRPSPTTDTPSQPPSQPQPPSLSLSFQSLPPLEGRPHFTSPESQNSVVGGLSEDEGWTPPSWKDVNAVTIVQTTDSSQVLSSGEAAVVLSAPSSGEVRILAHV